MSAPLRLILNSIFLIPTHDPSVRFLNFPLYTTPYPPQPIMFSSAQLLVASSSSSTEISGLVSDDSRVCFKSFFGRISCFRNALKILLSNFGVNIFTATIDRTLRKIKPNLITLVNKILYHLHRLRILHIREKFKKFRCVVAVKSRPASDENI